MLGQKNGHAALDQPMALEWSKKERVLMGRNEKPHPYGCGFLWARAVALHQLAPSKKCRLQGASLLHAFEDRGDALSAADAECRKTLLGIALNHFIKQCNKYTAA